MYILFTSFGCNHGYELPYFFIKILSMVALEVTLLSYGIFQIYAMTIAVAHKIYFAKDIIYFYLFRDLCISIYIPNMFTI